MQAGRKKVPNELLLLRGSRKARKGVARTAPEIAVPECPAFLDSVARREWERVTPILFAMRLITLLDMAALAGYCQSYATYQHAMRALKKYGPTFTNDKGFVGARPEEAIANRALSQIRAFCAEFGLTPSSRARMEVQVAKNREPYDRDGEGDLD